LPKLKPLPSHHPHQHRDAYYDPVNAERGEAALADQFMNQATMKETTKPMMSTVHSWASAGMRPGIMLGDRTKQYPAAIGHLL